MTSVFRLTSGDNTGGVIFTTTTCRIHGNCYFCPFSVVILSTITSPLHNFVFRCRRGGGGGCRIQRYFSEFFLGKHRIRSVGVRKEMGYYPISTQRPTPKQKNPHTYNQRPHLRL